MSRSMVKAQSCDCSVNAWIRAQDLRPNATSQGQVRIVKTGTEADILDVIVRLELKEQASIKYKTADVWKSQAEQVTVFTTQQSVGSITDSQCVRSFSLKLPDLNLPPADTNRFQHRQPFMGLGTADSDTAYTERIYEYTVDFILKSGETISIPAGYTIFLPQTKGDGSDGLVRHFSGAMNRSKVRYAIEPCLRHPELSSQLSALQIPTLNVSYPQSAKTASIVPLDIKVDLPFEKQKWAQENLPIDILEAATETQERINRDSYDSALKYVEEFKGIRSIGFPRQSQRVSPAPVLQYHLDVEIGKYQHVDFTTIHEQVTNSIELLLCVQEYPNGDDLEAEKWTSYRSYPSNLHQWGLSLPIKIYNSDTEPIHYLDQSVRGHAFQGQKITLSMVSTSFVGSDHPPTYYDLGHRPQYVGVPWERYVRQDQ